MNDHFLDCGFWPAEPAPAPAPGGDAAAVRSILVIFFCGIGDLVVFIPALEELARFFARARLSVIASPPAGEVLRNHPAIRDVFTVEAADRPGFLHSFDLVINLSGRDQRLNDLLRRARVKHLVSKSRLFERRGQHAADYHLALVRDIEARFTRPLLFLSPAERRAGSRWLAAAGLGDRLAAVHPGSGNPRKNWDEKSFARVCTLLHRDHAADVLLLAGPDERELCPRIIARARGRIVLVDEPLRLVAALLERCRLLLCNDSGVMHLAAAVGTPVICLFNSSVSRPEIWGPLSPRHMVIARESHAAITVAEVMRSIAILLKDGRDLS